MICASRVSGICGPGKSDKTGKSDKEEDDINKVHTCVGIILPELGLAI